MNNLAGSPILFSKVIVEKGRSLKGIVITPHIDSGYEVFDFIGLHSYKREESV